MCHLVMQAAAGQDGESWRSSQDGPEAANSYRDSIKAEYTTAGVKAADPMLQVGSKAYDEQQQMEQIDKLLQEEQVCSWESVCLDACCVLPAKQSEETTIQSDQLSVIVSGTFLRHCLSAANVWGLH